MTAVEFFDEQLEEFAISVDPNTRSMVIHISFDEYINIRKQALEMEKQQMEISDEEIEKASEDYEFKESIDFTEGAKWYREQLKQRK